MPSCTLEGNVILISLCWLEKPVKVQQLVFCLTWQACMDDCYSWHAWMLAVAVLISKINASFLRVGKETA